MLYLAARLSFVSLAASLSLVSVLLRPSEGDGDGRVSRSEERGSPNMTSFRRSYAFLGIGSIAATDVYDHHRR